MSLGRIASIRGPCRQDGTPFSADVVKNHVERAARRAQLTTASIGRDTRSVRISRCDGHQRGPFRNWLAIKISVAGNPRGSAPPSSASK